MVAVYRIAAPGGHWDPADNGPYEISLLGDAIEDIHGNTAAAAVLGTFTVNVPNIGQIVVDSLEDNPDANLADGVSDDGSGHSTLRAAIMQANQNPGLNTIVLPAGTFTLDRQGEPKFRYRDIYLLYAPDGPLRRPQSAERAGIWGPERGAGRRRLLRAAQRRAYLLFLHSAQGLLRQTSRVVFAGRRQAD